MSVVRVAVALALFLGTVRPAATFSGSDILEMCRTNPELAAMYAAALVDAHDDAAWRVKVIREKPGLDPDFLERVKDVETIVAGNYCAPKEVTVRQVGDVFCKFLRDNPAKRHIVAPLFSSAMRETWPCK